MNWGAPCAELWDDDAETVESVILGGGRNAPPTSPTNDEWEKTQVVRAAGLLPTGIHLATLQELELAFGRGTNTRIRLYESLRAFLELARSFQMFTSIVIDGSFVTNDPHPNDVDVVLILPGPQLKRLMSHEAF